MRYGGKHNLAHVFKGLIFWTREKEDSCDVMDEGTKFYPHLNLLQVAQLASLSPKKGSGNLLLYHHTHLDVSMMLKGWLIQGNVCPPGFPAWPPGPSSGSLSFMSKEKFCEHACVFTWLFIKVILSAQICRGTCDGLWPSCHGFLHSPGAHSQSLLY